MTNDVREIKKMFSASSPDVDILSQVSKDKQIEKLKLNLLLGNVDYVKKTLMENFCYAVKDEIAKISKNKGALQDYSIRPYVEMLQNQYGKIGEELPIYIAKMETFADYKNLLSMADFQIKTN